MLPDDAGTKDLCEARWEAIILEEMKRAHKEPGDVATDKKGASWKVAIARRLRRETTANNRWIAQRLCMGHPNYVSNLVHA